MLIKEMLRNGSTLSFEIFPPNRRVGYDTVKNAVDELSALNPSFISVTCGAGGGVSEKMVEISSHIQNDLRKTSLSHLTCTSFDKRELPRVLDSFRAHHITNILALRGDRGENFDEDAPHFDYAFELVRHIKQAGGFCIGGACYPEGHIESKDIDEDIFYLNMKVDAGCDFLITQLFFNNALFYTYINKMTQKNITTPVIVGVMPVTKARQIERMVALSGATIPPALQTLLDRYRDNDGEMAKAGIQYAAEQIQDLRANGFPYFHLYTMNTPHIAKRILEQLS